MLSGKKGLVVGVANKHSIAYHIAEKFSEANAKVVFGCHPRVADRVGELVSGMNGGGRVFSFDALVEGEVEEMVRAGGENLGSLDFLIHSIAFAPPEELAGRFSDTTPNGFAQTMAVSAYSLLAMARAARPYLRLGSSIITLTFTPASTGVIPDYGIMGPAKAALEAVVRYLANELGPEGARVNAIASGPIGTASARAIGHFAAYREAAAEQAPLGEVTGEDVAGAALFLASPPSSGVTGQVLQVDRGLSIVNAVGVPLATSQ